ncbi:MAG TPA: hypothetical protein VGX76_05300 [Pirellulales bacterium]|jgi:hypothetical protein|nr:hypothetical protein [Pirellulales bacterium]
MLSLANLLKNFGPTSGGTLPNVATLSMADNGNGTGAVGTIAGSTAGSSNVIYTAPWTGLSGNLVWTASSPRTGDGTIALAIANGVYIGYCLSTLTGVYTLSNEPVFRTTGGAFVLSVAPLGPQATFRLGIAYLIASSANFQALVGAASAAAALAHVLTESDDTEATGSTRPRAIVHPERFERTIVETGVANQAGSVCVSFEFTPSAGVLGELPTEKRWWDEMIEFENRLDAILNDMIAAQGVGVGYTAGLSQVSFNSLSLEAGPLAITETRGEGQLGETSQYFYGARFSFHWHK